MATIVKYVYLYRGMDVFCQGERIRFRHEYPDVNWLLVISYPHRRVQTLALIVEVTADRQLTYKKIRKVLFPRRESSQTLIFQIVHDVCRSQTLPSFMLLVHTPSADGAATYTALSFSK